MAEDKKTQAQKFKEIADAIRIAKGITLTSEINDKGEKVFYGAFSPNDFSAEIGKLTLNMIAPIRSFENGYYGLRAAKCAASYLWARINEDEKFAYRTQSIFSKSSSNGIVYFPVRDGEYARIDCSTFASLCLRGIPYDKSPYTKHKGVDENWIPSEELPSMCGTEGWEFREIDDQPEGVFNDIGIPGRSSVRLAAALGQYFHRYGYVLYDSAVNGKLASTNESHKDLKLQPGDLVFWDTKEDAQVDSRFKSISHVAIVSERPDYYYHVTGSTKSVGQIVVWYEEFAETDTAHPNSALVLAVRPDYRHGMPKEELPCGVNLLGFPWVYSRLKTSEKNGLTISLVDQNTIKVNGTATENTTLSLSYTTLSPGKYELTGVKDKDSTNTSFALQVRHADGADFKTPVRYPVGTGTTNEFVLTEEKEVNVRLFISEGKSLTDAIVTPTLIRN